MVEAEENPLEAAAKAENHQVVGKALVRAKATETEMETEMEHQVKMQEMITKMLQKRLLKPLMVLANAVRVQTQKVKRNVKPQNNQKKMLRMP